VPECHRSTGVCPCAHARPSNGRSASSCPSGRAATRFRLRSVFLHLGRNQAPDLRLCMTPLAHPAGPGADPALRLLAKYGCTQPEDPSTAAERSRQMTSRAFGPAFQRHRLNLKSHLGQTVLTLAYPLQGSSRDGTSRPRSSSWVTPSWGRATRVMAPPVARWRPAGSKRQERIPVIPRSASNKRFEPTPQARYAVAGRA